MNNLAENFEAIVEAETNRYDQMDCDVVEFSPRRRKSLSSLGRARLTIITHKMTQIEGVFGTNFSLGIY